MWFRKMPGKINTREIAETTKRNLEPRWKFKPGVIEEVVKRTEGLTDENQIVKAVEAAFLSHRISINPNWDGSVG